MYENLKVELARLGIKHRDVASYLNIHENTFANKITRGSFSIEEAFTIKQHYFPNCEISYLFKNSVTNPH